MSALERLARTLHPPLAACRSSRSQRATRNGGNSGRCRRAAQGLASSEPSPHALTSSHCTSRRHRRSFSNSSSGAERAAQRPSSALLVETGAGSRNHRANGISCHGWCSCLATASRTRASDRHRCRRRRQATAAAAASIRPSSRIAPSACKQNLQRHPPLV